jgi:uncharacterized protein YpmB
MIGKILIAFLLVVLVGVIIACISLYRRSVEIYRDLDVFMQRAKTAKYYADLKKVQEEVRVYITKYCWHQRHYAKAYALLSFIEGRLHHL